MFDKNKFSQILSEIANNYNSITELADKSATGRSYLSKYIHKKFDAPPSPDVLKKIAKYSNGIVDYYELMDICDYINLNDFFLETSNHEMTNLCYWNMEELKDFGFDSNDIDQIRALSKSDDIHKAHKISLILKKYPPEFTEKLLNMCILQKKNAPELFTNDVLPTTDSVIKLPVLGKISAGLPILAIENIEDYMPAPSSLLKHDHEYFYLRVQGDSMNKKFPEGSLLLIQKQNVLEASEIGVFRINGDDATVKQFKTEENGIITLSPMSYNPIHKEQKYNLKDVPVEIIGKVISFMGIL